MASYEATIDVAGDPTSIEEMNQMLNDLEALEPSAEEREVLGNVGEVEGLEAAVSILETALPSQEPSGSTIADLLGRITHLEQRERVGTILCDCQEPSWMTDSALVQRAESEWTRLCQGLSVGIAEAAKASNDVQEGVLGTVLPASAFGALLQPYLLLMLYPVIGEEANQAWSELRSPSARFLGRKGIYDVHPDRLALVDRHNHRHSPTQGHPTHPHFHATNFASSEEEWSGDSRALVQAHDAFIDGLLAWRWKHLPTSYTIVFGSPNKRFVSKMLREQNVVQNTVPYLVNIPEAARPEGWGSLVQSEYTIVERGPAAHMVSYVQHPSSVLYADNRTEYNLHAAVILDQVLNDVSDLCSTVMPMAARNLFVFTARPNPESQKATWIILWDLLKREQAAERNMSLNDIECHGGFLMRAWVEGCLMAMSHELLTTLQSYSALQKARWMLLQRNMRTPTPFAVDERSNGVYGDPLLGHPMCIESAQARTMVLSTYRQKALHCIDDSNAVFGDPLTGHPITVPFSSALDAHSQERRIPDPNLLEPFVFGDPLFGHCLF